jgi:hypothetical protein
MSNWLAAKWRWLVGGLATAAIFLVAALVGRKNRNGEVRLAVAEHELRRAQESGQLAEARVLEMSAKQRAIAEDILKERTRRGLLEDEWEKMDVEEVRRRLRALGLLK